MDGCPRNCGSLDSNCLSSLIGPILFLGHNDLISHDHTVGHNHDIALSDIEAGGHVVDEEGGCQEGDGGKCVTHFFSVESI